MREGRLLQSALKSTREKSARGENGPLATALPGKKKPYGREKGSPRERERAIYLSLLLTYPTSLYVPATSLQRPF
jgi:hypothetical protein